MNVNVIHTPAPLLKHAPLAAILLIALATLANGCAPGRGVSPNNLPPGVRGVNLTDPVHPRPLESPITLAGAKNEWISFVIRLDGLPARVDSSNPAYSLRIQPFQLQTANASISATNLSIAQVLPMPVDLNRAGFVRHTGAAAGETTLPRALLPLTLDNGLLNLASLRRPSPAASDAKAGDADIPQSSPPLLWIDLHIPKDARAGDYQTRCELMASGLPVSSLAIKLTVHDFALPDERHVTLVNALSWDDLVRLYPREFEVLQPRLLNRNDPQHADAVRTLDQLVELAHRHRTEVVIPRLQPTVKWPSGEAPRLDWSDLDSILTPWLSGAPFADKTPVGFWPMPAPDYLDRFDRASQLQYWAAAASHFDQLDRLEQTAVVLNPLAGLGPHDPSEALRLSAQAADVLKTHTRLRVMLPLEEDQLQLADADHPNMIPPRDTARLLTVAPGLVFSPPRQAWPQNVTHPRRWMRTDEPGLVPYVGAGGDERDVRVWAWLAYLRQATLIQWASGLPAQTTPTQPADPSDLIWFYPGSWFGLNQPVPTIQLKWLRRAEQDYEYLDLARQRGEPLNARVMARLIAKPVEIQPNQRADPAYAMMSGTTDEQAWDEVIQLLAKTILLRQPGQTPDPTRQSELNLETLRWMKPQERPLLMVTQTRWLWDALAGGNWISLKLGIDIYNASDDTPDQNRLGWTAIPDPSGWQMRPQPISIPALSTYQVRREYLNAKFDLNRINNRNAQPLAVTFTNGFTNKSWEIKFDLPVASSDQRQKGLAIDGFLDDWDAADQLQNGPMVRMLNRPALQHQQLQRADTPTSVYSGWSPENFYVAFKVGGLSSASDGANRNFVSYQFRRAWGEDLCEVLIQPVYIDNTVGPVTHLVCKPNGQIWSERSAGQSPGDEWQPTQGAGMRYAATRDNADWRGELAIPWSAIGAPNKGVPSLLRFNFVQHQQATGQSASWAGPIDFGRDFDFMGLLHLRIPRTPGMGN